MRYMHLCVVVMVILILMIAMQTDLESSLMLKGNVVIK